jgi:hypothetical protein
VRGRIVGVGRVRVGAGRCVGVRMDTGVARLVIGRRIGLTAREPGQRSASGHAEQHGGAEERGPRSVHGRKVTRIASGAVVDTGAPVCTRQKT